MPTNSAIYQIKISLQHTHIPIWRRILVEANTGLDEFHEIIQIAMGWEDEHLHQFIVNDTYYGIADPEFDMDVEDEMDHCIADVLKEESEVIVYEYDLGEGWYHDIVLEKMVAEVPNQIYPYCMDGENACPPEDIGGIYGYMRFLEVMHDPKHPEHEHFMSLLDGIPWDEHEFDKDEVNEIFANPYSHGFELFLN
jgi:hypothetical protein